MCVCLSVCESFCGLEPSRKWARQACHAHQKSRPTLRETFKIRALLPSRDALITAVVLFGSVRSDQSRGITVCVSPAAHANKPKGPSVMMVNGEHSPPILHRDTSEFYCVFGAFDCWPQSGQCVRLSAFAFTFVPSFCIRVIRGQRDDDHRCCRRGRRRRHHPRGQTKFAISSFPLDLRGASERTKILRPKTPFVWQQRYERSKELKLKWSLGRRNRSKKTLFPSIPFIFHY